MSKLKCVVGLVLITTIAGLVSISTTARAQNGNRMPIPDAFFQNVATAGQLDWLAAKDLDAGDYADAEVQAREAENIGVVGDRNDILAQALEAEGKYSDALAVDEEKFGPDEANRSSSELLRYSQLLLIAGRNKESLTAFELALPHIQDLGIRHAGSAINDGALVKANALINGGPTGTQEFAAAIHVARGICDNNANYASDGFGNNRAIKQYTAALALEPTSGFVNYYYACGLEQLGRKDDARAAFAKTIMLSDGDINNAAHERLADLGK